MNVTRVRHLENALSHFDRTIRSSTAPALSIESHLRNYFRAHKGKLNTADTDWLADKFKDVYRWRGLINHFSSGSDSASDILRVYFGNGGWRSYSDSRTLPEHVRVSMPESLYSRLASHYGKSKALDIGNIWNEKPNTFLRVNTLVADREEVFKGLTERGISSEKTVVSDVGLKVGHIEDLTTVPEFKDHACALQDESCQIVGAQVAVQPGQKVLDYCAGSGGKSLVFGPDLNGKGHLFLHDVNENFLVQARRKLRDAKIKNFTCVAADSPQLKKLYRKMDWVLVDPPSTGSGHYRRYPERKWLFSEESLAEKIEIQKEIFKNALKFMKKGGKIVYSTSSILPEENAEQIKYFCNTHNLYLSEEPVYALPQSRGMDGFFCAILESR